jgi:putative salt-induced outer membrane protein YdiY
MSRCLIIGLVFIATSIPAIGQDQGAQPPVKVYTGNFGAGLSVTRGNTDNTNFNLSFELTRDPKAKTTTKANGFYLRSSNEGNTISDMLRLGFREDYFLTKRLSLYGSMGYLRDPFKDINYLLNPQGGLAVKVYSTDRTAFTLSAGAGCVWEKNPGIDVHTSGTFNAAESYTYKISDTSKLVQNWNGMWKTSDFGDALHHFDISIVTSVVKRIDLKLEFMDEYKTQVRNGIKKNDTALIASFLYKI